MNGHGEEEVPEQSIEEGLCATCPEPEPSEEDFAFLGWYKDMECTQMYSFLSPVTEDITLYAKWVESIEITLYSNNGYGNGSALAFIGEGGLTLKGRPGCESGTVEGYYTDSTLTTKVAEADGTLLAAVEGYTDQSARWVREGATTLVTRWQYGVGFIDPFGYLATPVSAITVKQGEIVTSPEVTFKTPAAPGYEYRWSTVPPDYYREQTAFVFGNETTEDLHLYLLYTYAGNDFSVGYALSKNYVFKYTGTAVNVTVPSNINGKKISEARKSTFRSGNGVAAVENVVFEEGIEVLRSEAFNIVPSLRSVTIPSSVTTLEDKVFSGCTSLESVTLKRDSVYPFPTDLFYNCNAPTNIYVPENLVDEYKSAEGWSAYASKISKIAQP